METERHARFVAGAVRVGVCSARRYDVSAADDYVARIGEASSVRDRVGSR
jgi:hypothetical protein